MAGENSAGVVSITLKANLVSCSEGMKQASATANASTKELADSVDTNMRSARGSIMLLEAECGVHLPRSINTLIAEIPGIGAAFEALLPVMAAVFAVTTIEKFIDKHEQLAAAARKAAVAAADL